MKMKPEECWYCEELIVDGDKTERFESDPWFHMDCHARAVIGSVAHIQQRCSCYIPGSTEGDPPGMTKRQAARAAVEALRLKNYANVFYVDGACVFCACEEFHPGPRAGAYSRNVMCALCGTKFLHCPPFQPAVVYNDDSVYDRSVRERLPKGQMARTQEALCDE